MSNREDIHHGRLIYTCNCGWLDLGHLKSSLRPHASARYLWQDILHERGLTVTGYQGKHFVGYKQSMSRTGISAEHFRTYWIKKGLSINEKQSIALSIFMEVSLGFEGVQERYSLFTNSGYSEEDLVSNLVGFYVEVLGINWATTCKPVSVKASQSVWDKAGPVGLRKNRSFKPNFHDCDECISKHGLVTPVFPPIFNSI
ncbi:hypothetical protein [Noviherbaspirillum aerium]|uniref:hypothetical protein n=1 Tax=Noviherbaspirillum aerium TaxID=2588497 RepID=UPI001CEF953C|nr:hypothetical protein [Noviherbaspirillum aerium]